MKRGRKEEELGSDLILGAAFDALRPDDDGGIVPELDELSKRRRCNDLLALHRANRLAASPKERPTRQRVYRMAGAAIVLLSCGLGIWNFHGARNARTAPSSVMDVSPSVAVAAGTSSAGTAPLPSRIPGSNITLLMGEVSVGDTHARMGAELSTATRIRTGNGQAVITLPSGIAVGLSKDTEARLRWDGKAGYGVSLARGMALFSVDPFQSRDGFFVDTPAGTLRVKGTLFTVIVSNEKGVFAQLHRGRIAIEGPHPVSELAGPGELIRIDKEAPVSEAMVAQVFGQLQALRCMDRGEVFSELTPFECLHNAVAQKPTPKPVASGRRDRFAARLSINDLMNLARSQKRDGNWTGAATTYKTLIRRFPDTDAARTSRVALAQIQLKHLGEARAAVRQFSKYLTAPGPLTQEALFGKAQAYQALGAREDEARILIDYLATFPAGAYVAPAKRRLGRLRRNAGAR